jgi:anaerobic selenocysteine-containing dehydrogenase
MIGQGRQKIGVYMVYQHNPAYSDPQCSLSSDLLRNEDLIPFLVVVDSVMSETASLADVVLPAATYLERLELDFPPSLDMVPFVSLRQPVVEPLGEARPFMDVLIELAIRTGGGMERYFDFARAEDYWEATISRIPRLRRVGGLTYLKDHGYWYDPKAKPMHRSYQESGFRTPSGKFEIYSKPLEERGFSPLPVYQPIEAHRSMRDDEFHLIVHQQNVHTRGFTANFLLLSEIAHDNHVWMNSNRANAIGVEKGDVVRITSNVGSITAKVWPSPGVHPKVLAMSDGCGHWEYGRIAQATRFESEDPHTELLWWDEEGNGVHPNPIIPVLPDPIGGGQAWMDTTVTIAKA